MHRRDFLKLAFGMSLGLFVPQQEKKMYYAKTALGQIYEKIGRGQTLDPQELQMFTDYGDQLWFSNSFSNTINKDGGLSSDVVRAKQGLFQYPPVDACHIGYGGVGATSYPQNLTASNTSTTCNTFPSQQFSPSSIMQWYNQSVGKLKFSPFMETHNLLMCIGYAQVSSPCTNMVVGLKYTKISDGSTIGTQVFYSDLSGVDVGGSDHAFIATTDISLFSAQPSDIAAEFVIKATYTSGTRGFGIDATFFRVV